MVPGRIISYQRCETARWGLETFYAASVKCRGVAVSKAKISKLGKLKGGGKQTEITLKHQRELSATSPFNNYFWWC